MGELYLVRVCCVDVGGAVSCLIVLSKLLHTHEVGTEASVSSHLIHSIIAVMKQWRIDADNVFLLDADISSSSATWPVIAFNVELAAFMSYVISTSSSVLSTDEWDLILCSLVAWFQTVQSASVSLQRTPCVMSLITAVSRLLRQISVCVDNVVPHQMNVYPSNLISEWHDVFSVGVFELALSLFVSLACDATSFMVRKTLLFQLPQFTL